MYNPGSYRCYTCAHRKDAKYCELCDNHQKFERKNDMNIVESIAELQPYAVEIARKLDLEVNTVTVNDGVANFAIYRQSVGASCLPGTYVGAVTVNLRVCHDLDGMIDTFKRGIHHILGCSRYSVQSVDEAIRKASRYWQSKSVYDLGFRNAYGFTKTIPTIKKVHFNDPATVVMWADGTKTVVKTQNGESFDPEKGLAMAIAKKALGNKGNYFDTIKKWVDEYIPHITADKIVVRPTHDSSFGVTGEIVCGSAQETAEKLEKVNEALAACGMALNSLRKEGSE